MESVKYNIRIYVDQLINKAVCEAVVNSREKYALRSLARSSFRENIRKYQYHLVFDSGFMSRKSYDLIYPCYFQHG